MHTREEKNCITKDMFFSELFELPCESLNLLKGDRLVHCSVENVAVLCKNHHESHKFELAHLKKKKKKKKMKKKKRKKKKKKKKKKKEKKLAVW